MQRGLLLAGLLLFVAGCADRIINIRYTPPPPASSFTSKLVVREFVDARGKEGDGGDPVRVGGGYGQYGNRVWKVMNNRPWLPILQEAIVSEFRAQGVDADSAALAQPGSLILSGEVRNFSTEVRWNHTAHVSALITLTDPDGRQRLAKQIVPREQRFEANFGSEETLEELMNIALKRFAQNLASDPDIKRTMGR